MCMDVWPCILVNAATFIFEYHCKNNIILVLYYKMYILVALLQETVLYDCWYMLMMYTLSVFLRVYIYMPHSS